LEGVYRAGQSVRDRRIEGFRREAASGYRSGGVVAMMLPYSQGQIEDRVNKLKLLKRSKYGRGKFDLLRQRVLYIHREPGQEPRQPSAQLSPEARKKAARRGAHTGNSHPGRTHPASIVVAVHLLTITPPG